MGAPDLTEGYKGFMERLEALLEHNAGISVGTTPSEVIYREGKMSLLHYVPIAEKVYPVPVFIVYAFVNRYYIMDLQPDKSVVRGLLDGGFDTYIVDWGFPSGDDRYLTFNDYVNGYMDNAIDRIRKISGSDKVTLVGVCQGGVLSLIYASLHPEKVKNLIALNTPVNFDTDKSLLNIWGREMDIDRIVDSFGIVPGQLLNVGYFFVDPLRHMIDIFSGVYDRVGPGNRQRMDEESMKTFLRIVRWGSDSPGQAGEVYRQFIRDCYQRNLLIMNKMEIDGRKIDLKKITMPLLNIMAKYDNFIPNESSIPLNEAVSSMDKTMAIFPTGHLGIFVGYISQRDVLPVLTEWLKPRSLL